METAPLLRKPDLPEFDFRRYLRIFWKFKWIFLLVFVGVSAAFAYVTMTAPKVYEAVTTVEINSIAPQVLSEIREVVELGTGGYWANKDFYQTQYEVIRSRAVAQRVVEREGLDRDPDFLGLNQIADPAEREKAAKSADAAGILISRVAVEPVKESRLARVRVEDFVADRAVRLSIAVARAYRDVNLERKIRESVRALASLKSQVEDLRKALEESEAKLVEFKRAHGVVSISLAERQNVITQELLTFSDRLAKAESHVLELRAKLEQAKKADPARLAVEQQELEAKNPMIGDLLRMREGLRQKLTDLLFRYKEKHPKVQAVQAQLDLAEKRLKAAREKAEAQAKAKLTAELTALKRSLAAAERAHDGYKKLLQRTNTRAQSLSDKEKEYLQLQRVVEENRRLYTIVSKRYKEVELAKEIHNNNVAILDEARGARLVRPRLLYNLLFGLMLGVVAGLGVVATLNFFDKTVKSQEDIEQVLGLSFLGVIPTVRDDAGNKVSDPELHVHTHPKSTVAELCRTVRTNIQFMSPDRVLKKLLITSPAPLDGKTTVALSLGISMAQAGSRVLMVSSDMRRPRMHEPFGLRGAQGISNWIVGEADIDDILHPTHVTNLTILPCGPIPPNPAEILQAEKFHRLVEELERRFDRILFDSPPVGAVSDPLILGAAADGVILVVRAGVSTKDMLRHAHRKLQAVNAHLLGCVLNNLDLRRASYGYGYYAQGYYHSYTADGSTART